MTVRTRNEVESSQYFSHWADSEKHTAYPRARGVVARILRKPIRYQKPQFRTMTEEEALAVAMYGQQIDIPLHQRYVEVDQDGSRKVIGNIPWLREHFLQAADRNLSTLYRESPWVFRAVDIRATLLSSIPFQVLDDNDNEIEELQDLLAEFNPETNWVEAVQALAADRLIFGRAVWQKVMVNDRIRFLQRLAPPTLEFTKDQIKRDGVVIPRKELLLFNAYDPEGTLAPVSPLYACRHEARVDVAATKQLTSFFRQGALPDMVFSLETTDPNQIKRVSAAWQLEHGGVEQFHKTAFVGGGAKPQQMGFAPDELALSDIKASARMSIAAAFGVPPTMLGAMDTDTRAVAEKDRKQLLADVIVPEAEAIAGVINAELMPQLSEGKGRFEWDFAAVEALQADRLEQAQALQILVAAGAISPQQMAEEMGFFETPVPSKTLDLRRWHTKSMKALKQGKPMPVAFWSEYLTMPEKAEIVDRLRYAKTEAELDDIFLRR